MTSSTIVTKDGTEIYYNAISLHTMDLPAVSSQFQIDWILLYSLVSVLCASILSVTIVVDVA
jgi:hypothetical protein